MLACLLVNSIFLSNITARAQGIASDNIIYYDGIGFRTSLDDNGNLSLQSLSNAESNAYFVLYSDGTANAFINNKGDIENYYLDIHEMNDESIDIDVYDSTPNINSRGSNVFVKKYNSYNELEYDQYHGQASFGSFLVYSLSLLLNVLMVLALTVVVGGLTLYCIVSTIDIIKEKTEAATASNRPVPYYRATIQGSQVVIDLFNPIDASQAVSRLVTGNDTYTYLSTAASFITFKAAGIDRNPDVLIIGPEIDDKRKDGYIYFYHFHVSRSNPSHSFFGFPFTK